MAHQPAEPVDGQSGLVGGGDVDWFAVETVAGGRYVFETALVSLPDSVLCLYDRDGATLIEYNDDVDWPSDPASRIDWTAETGGTYHLAVSAYDASQTGQYLLNVEFVNHVPILEPVADQTIAFDQDAVEVVLAATDADVDLRLANLVHHSGYSVTVHGTRGDDTLEFSAGEEYGLTINGFLYQFQSGDVSAITFEGGAGNDSAVLRGSAGNDSATIYPHGTTLSGSGYRVVLNGVSRTVFHGGGGSDSVRMYDSAGNDTFVGTTRSSTFYGNGFYNVAKGFDQVQAYSTRGGSDANYVSAVDYVLATFGDYWRRS